MLRGCRLDDTFRRHVVDGDQNVVDGWDGMGVSTRSTNRVHTRGVWVCV